MTRLFMGLQRERQLALCTGLAFVALLLTGAREVRYELRERPARSASARECVRSWSDGLARDLSGGAAPANAVLDEADRVFLIQACASTGGRTTD